MENPTPERAMATTADDDLDKLKNSFFSEIDKIIDTLKANEDELLKCSIADLEKQKKKREADLRQYKEACAIQQNGTSQ